MFNISRLEKIAAIPEQYPPSDLCEVAFAGRSNVGKSSLINGLIQRKNLARTSSKPGKTRTVNFYNVDEAFRLVDLPGYGYASVSKSEKEKWATTIETYLHHRDNLCEVVLVVDARHEPSVQDKQMYEWILHLGFTGFVVATKTDKLSKNKLNKTLSVIRKSLKIDDPDLLFPISSEKKTNMEFLREQILAIVEYGNFNKKEEED